MNIVEINVTGSTVIGGGVNVGAAGSHHDVALRITFDSEWDNLSKKILWQNSRGLNTVYTLLDSDFLAEGETRVYLVPIPSEPKEFAGNMQFSVKGFSETNGSITIAYTASCTFVVSPSVNDSDAREAEETKTAAISEQLQAKVDNLKSGVNNLQTDKVDKVNGKGLSTEDYTTEEKAKLEGIEAGAQVNTVDSVAGKTGAVVLAKGDVGLSNVDNTRDLDKPISTAQQAALNTKANASDVVAIQSKIPSQATSDNQLADKDFVNSSISTNTATYRSNNGQPFTSEAQLLAYEGEVDNNDYAFVTGTDSAGNAYYDKYKASVNGNAVTWGKEYRLNNSSFTAAQWAAITSGITAALVNQITANQQAILSMAQSIANKVDKVEGKSLSTNDYTTAEKNKLDGIETGAEVNTVDSVAGKTGAVVLAKGDVGLSNVDNTRDSDKPISTEQQTALDGKQDTLVSGTNIKTINNESLLGSGNVAVGRWKLLGESEIESGTSDAIPIGITESSFFVNPKYKKFKLVFEILAIDTYTYNYFCPRIYFQKDGTLGYRLFNSYGTSTGAVYKNNEIFYGQLVIERQQDINKCFTILLSPSNSGVNGTLIYGAGNAGVFENNITATELNRIIVVNAMGTYDMAAGSKAWLYVWEE